MSRTILMVDDEPRIVSLVESYLTQFGYRVVTAYNGEEALERARQEHPDLIILDIMMPKQIALSCALDPGGQAVNSPQRKPRR